MEFNFSKNMPFFLIFSAILIAYVFIVSIPNSGVFGYSVMFYSLIGLLFVIFKTDSIGWLELVKLYLPMILGIIMTGVILFTNIKYAKKITSGDVPVEFANINRGYASLLLFGSGILLWKHLKNEAADDWYLFGASMATYTSAAILAGYIDRLLGAKLTDG